MAEIFGTAASVLQVAEVGFSLATTLYKYAASVKGAEKEIKKIARDVKLTSKVLERTHAQLKADQEAQLCTDDALYDLEEVLDGCKEAFQEVDTALSKTLKPGADGKAGISTFEKLKWPFRNDKLEVLRANLEKLKTTLLLMLSVLAYGSKISQNRTEHTSVKVELTLEKLQIQNLVQAKDEATQRYEELSAAFQKLETRISNSTNSIPGPEIYTTSLLSMPQPQDPGLGTTSVPDPSTSVSSRLSLCTTAVSKLTISIEAATKLWDLKKILEHGAITSSLNETTAAVQALQLESSGNHALQDFQLQMMLLEQQNKKRLLMARQEQDAIVQQQSVQAPVPQQQTLGHLTQEQQEQLQRQREQQRQLQIQAMAQQRCFTGRQQQQAMQMAQQQSSSGLQPQMSMQNRPMTSPGNQNMVSQNTQQQQQRQQEMGQAQSNIDQPELGQLMEELPGPLRQRLHGMPPEQVKQVLERFRNRGFTNNSAGQASQPGRFGGPSLTPQNTPGLDDSQMLLSQGRLPAYANPQPAHVVGPSLPAALLQDYPALASVRTARGTSPVPKTPAHPASIGGQVGELQDSGELALDLNVGPEKQGDGPSYEEHNAAGTFDFSGFDLEYIPKSQKPAKEESLSVPSRRLGRARAKSDMPPKQQNSDMNMPFGAFDDDQFGSMDFANTDSGEVLDKFDFDSFLDNTARGDEGLGFDVNTSHYLYTYEGGPYQQPGTSGAGGREIRPKLQPTSLPTLYTQPSPAEPPPKRKRGRPTKAEALKKAETAGASSLRKSSQAAEEFMRPNPSSRRRGRAGSDPRPPEIGANKRRRGSSSDGGLENREKIMSDIPEDMDEDEDEEEEESASDGDEDAKPKEPAPSWVSNVSRESMRNQPIPAHLLEEEDGDDGDGDDNAVNDLLKRWTKVAA